jgi:hypothetical protein
MKYLFLLILVFVFLSCGIKKSEKKEIQSKEIEKNEIVEIVFEEEAHDFGELKSGEIVAYSFVFINTGKQNLVIKNAESDCNCVQVSFPKEPIKPGKKGIIEVEFDSSGMFGKNLRTIEIESNSQEIKHLVIFANIINEQIEINY